MLILLLLLLIFPDADVVDVVVGGGSGVVITVVGVVVGGGGCGLDVGICSSAAADFTIGAVCIGANFDVSVGVGDNALVFMLYILHSPFSHT